MQEAAASHKQESELFFEQATKAVLIHRLPIPALIDLPRAEIEATRAASPGACMIRKPCYNQGMIQVIFPLNWSSNSSSRGPQTGLAHLQWALSGLEIAAQVLSEVDAPFKFHEKFYGR